MTASKPPPEWLTTPEVATRFAVTPAAVIRWAEAGTIPRQHWLRTPGCASRSGNYRIRAAWVDRYLNGNGDAP
jgi:hypothetical protein